MTDVCPGELPKQSQCVRTDVLLLRVLNKLYNLSCAMWNRHQKKKKKEGKETKKQETNQEKKNNHLCLLLLAVVGLMTGALD